MVGDHELAAQGRYEAQLHEAAASSTARRCTPTTTARSSPPVSSSRPSGSSAPTATSTTSTQIARIDHLCDDLGLDTMDVGAAMGVAMEGGRLAVGRRPGRLRPAQQAHHRRRERAHARRRVRRHRQAARRHAASRPSRARASPPTTRACSRAPAPRTSRARRAPTTRAATRCPARPTPATTRRPRGPGADVGVPAVLLRGHRLAGHVPVRDAAGARHPRAAGPSSSRPPRRSPAQDLPDDYLIRLGDGIVRGERDFNRRAGFTETDDRPPAFLVEEAVEPSGNRYDVAEADLDAMFAE